MKWNELGLAMQLWWGAQLIILAIVILFNPVLLGLSLLIAGATYFASRE